MTNPNSNASPSIKINPQGHVFYYIGSTNIRYYLQGTEVIYNPLTGTFKFTSYYSKDVSKALHYLDWWYALINTRNTSLMYSDTLSKIVTEANELITVIGNRTDTIGATPWKVSMGRHEIHTNLRKSEMYWARGGMRGINVTYENLAQCRKPMKELDPISLYLWAFEQGKKYTRGVDAYSVLKLHPNHCSPYLSPSTPWLNPYYLEDITAVFTLGTHCKEDTPYELVEWTDEGPILNVWDTESYYKDNNAPI